MPAAPTSAMRTNSLSCLGPHGFHRITYREWGEPDHPHVVVCVHGLTRNSRDFDPLAAHLAKRCRVICPDIAGRGESPWLPHPGDYGYPLYLSDMAALIARAGVETVDWVGTSMGGLIGMFLAAQPGNPIRRLVMNDVGPLVPKAALERLASYVGVDPAFDGLPQLEQYLRQICAPFGPLTDAQWQHLARHSARQRDHGKLGLAYDPAIGDALRAPLTDVALWPVWNAVRAPVLLVRGAESDLLPPDTARQMMATAPAGSRFAEFAGAGHAPMLMADDQITAVEAFLL